MICCVYYIVLGTDGQVGEHIQPPTHPPIYAESKVCEYGTLVYYLVIDLTKLIGIFSTEHSLPLQLCVKMKTDQL